MNVCILQMLDFDRIAVSERTDVNKTSASKEYDICHYWCFLNKGFVYKTNVCNRCHDWLMVSISVGYCFIMELARMRP